MEEETKKEREPVSDKVEIYMVNKFSIIYTLLICLFSCR